MFTIYDEKTRKPIRIWLDSRQDVEDGCMQQAYNLSQLPFIHKWVALMPDTHMGKGMPIGGVIACDHVVIPNAVGSDIGCGMGFVGTNIPVAMIKEITTDNGTFIQGVIGDILREIPVGFQRHQKPMPCRTLDQANQNKALYEDDPALIDQLEHGYYQIGTLGGGNHFIELQEDQNGYLGIMIHSGSRHMGKSVCDYFHHIARDLNVKWHSSVPDEFRLAFLPDDTKEGERYIRWMNLCLDFAYENREKMMGKVKEILEKWIGKYTDILIEYSEEINCHHNYASLETHYEKEVWVHRKGATRAENGDLAVIPGAMGSYSYVVMGRGNKESFCSSSHGAGRQYSRKAAMNQFTTEEVMADLKTQGVTLGKRSKNDVAEESRFAYKDIDMVMSNQEDLVIPVKKLKTIGVVKG